MIEHQEWAHTALTIFFIAAFCFTLWQRDRMRRLYETAKEHRDHWKDNYEIAEGKLVIMERYVRRVKITVRDEATPAFERVRNTLREIGEAADGDRA
jgi:hypothetical protein